MIPMVVITLSTKEMSIFSHLALNEVYLPYSDDNVIFVGRLLNSAV